MRVSARGRKLITDFEGFRAKAYRDVVGILTIGYGFTEGVSEGDTMTREQADSRLIHELAAYEQAVSQAAGECNQHQFDALCSFAWNVGIVGMKGSSVIKAHRRGDHQAAARAFGLWNKAGGKVFPGLVRRRAAEAAMYLEPMPDDESAPVEGPEDEMPQRVDSESSLMRSPIVAGSGGIGALTLAAEGARSVADIRDSLGDWLPYVLGAAVLALAGYLIWQRVKQRHGGWA
jgi:lysozyme